MTARDALMERRAAPIAVSLSGQCVDRFTKVDGRWRFADRLITTDLGTPSPVRPPILG